MIGNAALMDLPDKVTFLSSRRISAVDVLKCYELGSPRDSGKSSAYGNRLTFLKGILEEKCFRTWALNAIL